MFSLKHLPKQNLVMVHQMMARDKNQVHKEDDLRTNLFNRQLPGNNRPLRAATQTWMKHNRFLLLMTDPFA